MAKLPVYPTAVQLPREVHDTEVKAPFRYGVGKSSPKLAG